MNPTNIEDIELLEVDSYKDKLCIYCGEKLGPRIPKEFYDETLQSVFAHMDCAFKREQEVRDFEASLTVCNHPIEKGQIWKVRKFNKPDTEVRIVGTKSGTRGGWVMFEIPDKWECNPELECFFRFYATFVR